MILIHIHKYKVMDRLIALEILLKYKQEKSYLNLTINSYFQKYELSRSQKDFITRVVYGTVQNQIYLEYVLKPHLKTRVKSYEKMLLLMSLYQHLMMDAIPDYAIINEAVNLAKKKKGIRTSQFINAVLKQAFLTEPSLEELSKEERLSIETSHPLWMVKMLCKQYGYSTTQKICQANNEPPLKCARVNTLLTSQDELLKDELWQKGKLAKDALYYQGGNIAYTKEFQEGLVTIQDESSQLVAPYLSPKPGDYVLDMCAAPGSKTTHLAALMHNQGKIDAYDLYEHKIPLIQQQLTRLQVSIVDVKAYDSTKLIELYPPLTFDKILLDAPCSGLGVLARKPEIKYHESNAMDEIIQIQQKLLENAYPLLKNGGNIVYSTCTINKKENEKQIQAFIKRHPDMKVIKEQTILSFEYHSDGFYMCLLEKE
ncbi:16S rRNA (cytosine967-C5)-methyltransferase [Longibaculum muris]|uniref:16S rRNA (cytosine(967)-C(5))-methyltransferase n=2 Tax=Longibaculum muris TaxID=1796628 RepID=A0A4R3Z2U6_9FIRM|nr:ribosomal RNA small subunit methyltransferase B [Candidatus Stoquefichus sp. KLE1796]TCV99375.1 16S rRNA (cytosine967-C5)-methyltransferase [Longibaculum muris]